tara:strand:- start:75 stop:266 length:192 start_codon:yes stop_codon:yes gene_type:complete
MEKSKGNVYGNEPDAPFPNLTDRAGRMFPAKTEEAFRGEYFPDSLLRIAVNFPAEEFPVSCDA